MLLGGHLLLSGRNPTDADLRLLEKLTADPDISDGRKTLVRAFISHHRKSEMADQCVLTTIFIMQSMEKSNPCIDAMNVKNALIAIMNMFVKGDITLWELQGYMEILRTGESDPNTNGIIKLLTGLYDGSASLDSMKAIIVQLIGYVATNTPDTCNEEALLALYILTKIPLDDKLQGVKEAVQVDYARTMALNLKLDDLCIRLTESHDNTRRKEEDVSKQIGSVVVDIKYWYAYLRETRPQKFRNFIN
jgi:hypothetical protein